MRRSGGGADRPVSPSWGVYGGPTCLLALEQMLFSPLALLLGLLDPLLEPQNVTAGVQRLLPGRKNNTD